MSYRKRDIYTLKNMYKNDEYDNIFFLCFFQMSYYTHYLYKYIISTRKS